MATALAVPMMWMSVIPFFKMARHDRAQAGRRGVREQMRNDCSVSGERTHWVYLHAKFLFFLTGLIAGSGIGLLQEYLVMHLQWRLAWLPAAFLAGFAGLAAGAALQKLYWAAHTDPLTQLGNRRSFQRCLNRELLWIKLARRDSVLVLVDVDNFKSINDTAGHSVGDRVLSRLSVIFRESAGAGGSVMRWGGDEFVFILHDCQPPAAAEMIGKIRERIRSDALVDAISISAGIAAITPQTSFDQAINTADSLLMRAKQMRNNCLT
ncbi:MAG: GGDEF domain-containing protein [Sporomusaceae bacterium]|nr:GGDEF domain-containing protein [Sporomusaceae bacterium]